MTSSVKVAHSRQMISIKNSPPCQARGPNGEGKSLRDHGKNVSGAHTPGVVGVVPGGGWEMLLIGSSCLTMPSS